MRGAFHLHPCPVPLTVRASRHVGQCWEGPPSRAIAVRSPPSFAAKSTTSKAIRTRGSVSRAPGCPDDLSTERAATRRPRRPRYGGSAQNESLEVGPASDVASVVATRGAGRPVQAPGVDPPFGVPKPSDGIQHARCLALAAERSPDWLLRDPALARLRTSRQGQKRRCADGRRWRFCQHAVVPATQAPLRCRLPDPPRFLGRPSGRYLVSRADGWSAVAAGASRIDRSVWRFHRCHTRRILRSRRGGDGSPLRASLELPSPWDSAGGPVARECVADRSIVPGRTARDRQMLFNPPWIRRPCERFPLSTDAMDCVSLRRPSVTGK